MKTVNPIKISYVFLFTVLVFIVVILTVNQAGASSIELSMNVEYSGGTEPEGSGPWATATFIDNGPDTVTLTMSAGNLVGSEFISVWMFNFAPDLDPGLLTFNPVGIPGSLPNSINTGINAFKAGPDKFYDIEFDFPPPKGNFTNKFTSGETVVYDITYTGPETMSALLFNFESTSDKNHDSYHSAMHVQSIGQNDGSGWVGNTTVVPEPISTTLFIAGGATLGFRRFLKKRKTA